MPEAIGVVVIMGVAGSGKTTVGRALAERWDWPFHDADDLHTPENREGMRRGIPLDDERRQPWLLRVRAVIESALAGRTGAVVACSALKEQYRVVLSEGLDGVRFVFLAADRDLVLQRLAKRKEHFAGPALLDSQFEALEPPAGALTVDASKPVAVLVDTIVTELSRIA